jgi:hypothetical protein
MKPLSLRPLSLALGLLAITLGAATPARADYSIVRWTWGDCKIWQDNGPPTTPWGDGWAILADTIATYDEAKVLLEDLYRQGVCR